jgi:hypothetical protein
MSVSVQPEERWFHGRFQLHAKLGAGGMGVIYKAYDTRREQFVALKTVERISPEGVMSLKREFRLASELRHPNLVRLYDLIAEPNACALSLELIHGETLLSYVRGAKNEAPSSLQADAPTVAPGAGSGEAPVVWLKEQGSHFDEARLWRVLPQLCAALDAIHEGGVVHRDIKPGNIMCTREGVVKLLDFGISRPAEWLIREGVAYTEGTPHYMSPEQARGEAAEPASDMYSFGVVLYVLLTGQPPFPGQSVRQLLQSHASAPPPPSALKEGIPPELERLCLALLEKNPARRPSARQAAEWLAQSGADAPRLSRPRPRRFVGRATERRELQRLCSDVLAGGRRGVLVRGPSGVGKSALCAEVVRGLSEAGWRVFSGRCYEREEVPYNALDSLVDEMVELLRARPTLLREQPAGMESLAAIFPTLAGLSSAPLRETTAAEGRRLALGALRGLLRGFRHDRPVVLWIDDLQWADKDSLELLSGLFDGDDAPSFFLLGTVRDGAEGETWNPPTLQLPKISTLRVSPFGAEEIQALLGGVNAEAIERLSQESRGNAFLATELVSAFLSGETEGNDLRALVCEKQARLAPGLREVVEVIAVAGNAVPYPLLRRAAAQSPAALLSALDDLRGARWLREIGGTGEGSSYDLYHDRLREIVYETLPEEARKRLHLRLAWLAGEDGAEPEFVAVHYKRAGEPEQAAPWLLAAAQRAAAKYAADRAASLYQQAIEAGGPTWRERQAAREARAHVLDRTIGRYAEAAEAYREAARHAPGERAVRLLLGAAEADLKQGKIDAALDACAQAMAPYSTLRFPRSGLGSLSEALWRAAEIEVRLRLVDGLPHRQPEEADSLCHLLYHRVGAVLNDFDLRLAAVFTCRSLGLALAKGSDEEVVDAIGLYATFFLGMRRGKKNLARARGLYNFCLANLHVVRDPEVKIFLSTSGLALLELLEGRFADAQRRMTESIEQYREIGRVVGFEVNNIRGFRVAALVAQGDLLGARDFLSAPFAQAIDTQDSLSLRVYAPAFSRLHLLMGDLAASARADEIARREAGDAPCLAGLAPQVYEAARRLALGDAEGSASLCEEVLRGSLSNGLVVFSEIGFRLRIVLAAARLALGKRARLRPQRYFLLQRAASVLEPLVEAEDPVHVGAAYRLLGLISDARGDSIQARVWLDRAVQCLSERGEALELAAALLARGAIFGQSHDIARGKDIVLRAHALDPAQREGFSWNWR